MPITDMRLLLKLNSKTYLQQDLPDHVFDCYLIPPRQVNPAEASKPSSTHTKVKVLIGGAKRQTLQEIQSAGKSAGLMIEEIVPALIGPVNAFELAEPDAFFNETIALVDIGFKNTSITILSSGDIVLNRVVAIGGDKLTTGLAEAMGISYLEAEGIKVGMPQEVQPSLELLISPLGRELRASIDFFEHQADKTVTQIFVSGGTARNECIVQNLQSELMVPCRNWNPTKPLHSKLPSEQAEQLEHAAPQLTVAMGAAAVNL